MERQQKVEEERHRREEERRREEAEKQELERTAQRREALIMWLKPFDFHSKHQSSAELRHEGTCGWLLEDPAFVNWRSGSGSNLLWLYGIRMSSSFS